MTTLKEIREKYPQYSDMSDEELADSFHRKFYSDMPKEQFYGTIGFGKENPSILDSLLGGAKTAFQSSMQGKQQFSTEHPGFGNAGLYGGGMEEMAFLSPKGQEEALTGLAPQAMATREEAGRNFEENPISTFIGSILGGTAADPWTLAMGPGAGAMKGSSIGSRAISGAKNYGLPVGGSSALLGGTQYINEDESRLKNAILSGTIGLALGGGLGAASSLLPGNLIHSFRGRLSPEELLANQEAARGTSTSLGRVLEDPTLSNIHENILKYTPFSGYQKGVNQTAGQIENRAEQGLEKLAGGSIPENEDVLESIQRQLQKSVGNRIKISDKNYRELDNLSKELGIKVSRDTIKESSNKMLEAIKSNPELERKVSSKLLNDLEFYAEPPLNEYGFNESNLTRSLLGEDQFEAGLAGKRNEAGKYGALKKSIDTDMKNAIEKSGNLELQNIWDKAQSYYKKEVVPTQASKIKKYINDPNLAESENILANFIKYGPKNDRVKLMRQLTEHLDEPAMNRLRYAIFSDEEGNASAKAITNAFNKLGAKQKAELIPDENVLNNIDQLSTLARLNPKAFHQMFNAETGQKLLALESLKAWGPGAATGAAALLTHGNPLGLTGILGTVAAGRFANKALTSEKVRGWAINQFIKENPDSIIPAYIAEIIGKTTKAGAREASIGRDGEKE